jgi:molecular chaperone GrpE (heat shock protein)
MDDSTGANEAIAPHPHSGPRSATDSAALKALLEELVADNAGIVAALKRLTDANDEFRRDFVRGLDLLREDFAGALSYRVLGDLCQELFPVLSAMEAMLERADFSDAAATRAHVDSLAHTLRNALRRMGAEKIVVAPGQQSFDPARHVCVRVVSPRESAFPSAAPRIVVRVVEDGFTLAGRVLAPARVEVQAEN